MLFEAKCTRPVYRVESVDFKGSISRTAFFHDVNAAQDYIRLCGFSDDVKEVKLDIVKMEFDGWKVVG